MKKQTKIDFSGENCPKMEVHGEELIEKIVRKCGNSGRIYLPQDWVGHSVKIIRIKEPGKFHPTDQRMAE